MLLVVVKYKVTDMVDREKIESELKKEQETVQSVVQNAHSLRSEYGRDFMEGLAKPDRLYVCAGNSSEWRVFQTKKDRAEGRASYVVTRFDEAGKLSIQRMGNLYGKDTDVVADSLARAAGYKRVLPL